MSKIDELLKGEKVEWKKIGDIKEIKVISPIKKINKKEYLDEGLYPIIDQGQKFIVGYTNDENATFEKNKYVVFGDHTESLKYIDFQFAQGADGIKVLKTNEEYLNSRYFYHAILNFYEMKGNYMRHFSLLKKTEIPIPSIEIQEKIVKILDKFTEYVTELQAELQARVKQYEYYRDELLSEDNLNIYTKDFYKTDVFRKLNYFKLQDLVNIIVGSDVPKNNYSKIKNEKYKIPIYSNGTDENSLYGYTDTAKVLEDSVTISSRGTIGYVSLRNEPYYPIVRLLCLIPKNDELNVKFLYYFLQQYKFNYVHTGIPSLTSDMVKNIKFPLPSILIQNIIVEILDKFQSLVSETKGLLPQEIVQRQKQYEFYREKLLTFDENMVQVKSSQVKSSQVKSSQVKSSINS